MNVQDAKSLTIPEGSVKMIHDNGNRLLWGAVGYNTKYAGNTTQETTTGKNLVDLVPATNTMPDKTQSATFDTVYEATLGRNVLHASGSGSYPYIGFTLPNRLTSGKYYAFMIKYRTLTTTTGEVSSDAKNFRMYPGRNNIYTSNTSTGVGRIKDESGENNIRLYDTQTYLTRCIRFYADPDVYDISSTPAWYTGFSLSWAPTGITGNVSTKEIWIADIQIYEISQTDWNSNNYTGTDFEKYTSGIPAPSPSYPMPISVVAGEQTVTVSDGVNSEDFTISLGAIELYKIGTYQDYIYNSEDDWYVHKASGKTTYSGGSDESWNLFGNSSGFYIANNDVLAPLSATDVGTMAVKSEYYLNCDFNSIYNSLVDYGIALYGATSPRNRVCIRNKDIATAADFKTWLSTHNMTVYYALATPTDTKITDATLVGQLNAVHEWLTRYGYNSTVTGNLPIIIDRTNL